VSLSVGKQLRILNKVFFFDIKRYSINDGPGIRITIFMKGCPLSCIWCHNPEGISPRKQKMYTLKKCIGCKRCVDNCPSQALILTPDGIKSDDALCNLCRQCVKGCPSLAMEMSGIEYSVDYLMREIEKEMIFIDQSGGGVTFSGGEPLLYPDVLLELLVRCGKIGIHRAVDTALHVPEETLTAIMNETDLFLIDLKHMDSGKHKQFCGAPNEQILSNLRMIAGAGKDFVIRIPLIEGFNADDENIIRSAEYLASLPWKSKEVHLLPLHETALAKHQKLGTVYNPGKILLAPPSEERKQHCINLFNEYCIKATIGGSV